MTLLIVGLLLFFVPHLIPLLGMRAAVVGLLGENGYKGLIALLSLGGIVVIVFGMSRAEYVDLWAQPSWAKHLLMTIMPISLILFACANFPNNIRSFSRHPMMIGTLLWSGAHLIANGDKASVILFGSFAAFALLAIISASMRGKMPPPGPHPRKKDLIAVVAGLVVYGVVLYFHGALFGRPLLG